MQGFYPKQIVKSVQSRYAFLFKPYLSNHVREREREREKERDKERQRE